MSDIISITEKPVEGIGREGGSLKAWANTDFSYDFALGGYPFLSGASDRYPSARALVQIQKQQLDISQDPGEQTLSSWWARSQRDWSGGAGQNYIDSGGEEVARTRYLDSFNINVWDDQKLQLLNDTSSAHSPTGTVLIAQLDDLATTEHYVFHTNGTAYGFVKSDGTNVTGTGTVPVTICSQGDAVFGVDGSGNLRKYTMSSGTQANAVVATGVTGGVPFYVKERLIVRVGAALHQVSPGHGGGAVSAAFYTHTDSDWNWIDVAETPTAILVSGSTASVGVIYSFTVEDTSGALTLGQGRVIAELPNGEIPTAMQTYLGTFLVLGTNKGARIGAISEQGTISYGPLSYDKYQVDFIELQDRFAYLGVTAGHDDRTGTKKTGLVRVDLSAPTSQGFYPYANDQSSDSSAALTGLCQRASTGNFAMAIGGSVYVTSSDLASVGYLTTSRVRYSTLEPKSYQLFRLTHGKGSAGRVTVNGIDEDDEVNSTFTYDSAVQLESEVGVSPDTPQEYMSFLLTLNRDTTTTGPLIDGWMVKALPLVERKQKVRVPLMCFGIERDRFGVTRGKTGDALTRYRDVRDSVAAGLPVLFQDLVTLESLIGVVEDLEFNQTSPPAGASGFGGVIYATIREL